MDTTQLTELQKIVEKLIERPDKVNEIESLLRNTLNSMFEDMECKCKRIFISKGNGTNPYYASVIPNKPSGKILKQKHITDYDIDIDLNSFTNNHNANGFTAREMVAWLLHEMAANVLTDETLLRFKKLIVKYYDIKEKTVLGTVDAYGMMLWIGIFSRTKKSFSDELTDTNILIKKWDIQNDWDSALAKYISANGGDMYKITDEYMERIDKTQLREFNELARKYSSYSLKYNNTDYSTMVKYIISTTDSELLRHYIEKEPQSVPINAEKDVFLLFDDSKLLLESADVTEFIEQLTSVDLFKKYRELKEDIKGISNQSDKLLCSAKLKELSRLVDDKFEEDGSSDLLQQLKYDIESLINELIDKDIPEEVSMIGIE